MAAPLNQQPNEVERPYNHNSVLVECLYTHTCNSVLVECPYTHTCNSVLVECLYSHNSVLVDIAT